MVINSKSWRILGILFDLLMIFMLDFNCRKWSTEHKSAFLNIDGRTVKNKTRNSGNQTIQTSQGQSDGIHYYELLIGFCTSSLVYGFAPIPFDIEGGILFFSIFLFLFFLFFYIFIFLFFYFFYFFYYFYYIFCLLFFLLFFY